MILQSLFGLRKIQIKTRTIIAGKKALSRKPVCMAEPGLSYTAIKTGGKCCQEKGISQQSAPEGHLQPRELLEIVAMESSSLNRRN